MKHTISSLFAVVMVVAGAGAASAQQQTSPPPTGTSAAPSRTENMGPQTRKPTNESKTKRELDAFLEQEEAASKSGSFESTLAFIDFPVLMVTDDSKGVPVAKQYTREEYVAMMKPMYDEMPKDQEVDMKPTYTVLSDSLVGVSMQTTMGKGKDKQKAKSAGLLVKRDGKWMWKVQAQAGWGDVMTPPSSVGR